MSDISSYVRLPAGLSDRHLTVVTSALDDEFAAQQIEFIRHVFGYRAFLREHERETPVSDAFLSVFVNLFEAIDANVPEDARRCATQLIDVLQVVFPGFDCDGLPSGVDG